MHDNRKLILEGARDRALEMFMPYLQKRGINVSISQLKQFLLNKFVTEAGMHNLSLDSNFYLLGVSRYYFEGNLTSNKRINVLYPNVKDRFIPEVCTRLDALVGILRNAYVDSVGTKWEQPEDFGNLTLEKLLKKYNTKINKALGLDVNNEPEQEVAKVSDDYTAGKNYTYEILYSFEDARKYNRATEPGAWCITYGKQHYDAYVRRLKIHYIVFAMNGYEEVPRKIGKGFTKRKPHDLYGNSLICVLQSNKSADPVYITSRWNHGSSADGTQGTEADHAYTTEEFLNIIGCDYSVLQRAYEQWQKNAEVSGKKDVAEMRADRVNAMRQLKYAQMLINGGANPFQIDIFRLIRPVLASDNTNYTPDKKGYNINGLFWISVNVNENEKFVTFMDRRVIHFDDYLVNNPQIGGEFNPYRGCYSDTYIVFKKLNSFMIYDRKRRRFLDLAGIKSFKHGSSNFTASFNTSGLKYGIVAMNGRQLALINTETMKPVKARNGSPWFEAIVRNDRRDASNVDYQGRVDIPYFEDGQVFKMVYDSSAGEIYYFSCANDSFVDIKSGVPEGFVLEEVSTYYLPSKNYLSYTNKPNRGYGQYDPECLYVFKNINDGSFFKIKGEMFFRSILRRRDIIGYVPKGNEYAYYADIHFNKLLEINGEPVKTKWLPAIEDSWGYMAISVSRWYKIEEGPYTGQVTYGDFWNKCYLYNPHTGKFYHDDISGYEFNVWGGGWIKKPGAVCGRIPKEQLAAQGLIYQIPRAEEVAKAEQEPVRPNEGRTLIGIIIREELSKMFGRLVL